jgi:ATP-binding cassette subfamily B protein
VAFTTLQTRLFFPIGSLLNVGVDIQTSAALFDGSLNTWTCRWRSCRERAGSSTRAARSASTTSGSATPRTTTTTDEEDWTLRGIDLEVAAGTRTAIVGETGSGKTTLGYLAARLYDAERGTVSLDGIDVRELSFDALSETVGVVSQETYLFHSSVRDNLRFARPDASDEEIEEAARAARIHDVVAELPEGYDTVVGERGFRFSGGEKQRIAIARTILRNPPVLVLDEATSALDVQTERAVEEALEGLAEGRTVIVIATPALHRAGRGPDRRARCGRDRRKGNARGAAGAGWALCGDGGADGAPVGERQPLLVRGK